MTFEITMSVAMLISAALAAWHAFATRPKNEALLLLIPAAGFGYLFPFVDVNIFGHYGFDGQLTVFTLPFHLGLSWMAFYYLALVLAERLLGAGVGPIKLAIVTGLLFGMLEYQWDLTLLAVDLMVLHVPSFAPYPYDFHPGVPMFHALLGFNWVMAFVCLRGARNQPLAIVVALVSMVVIPLSVMACVPLTEPMITELAPKLGRPMQHVADAVHFSTTYAGVAAIAGLWFRFIGKRMSDAVEPAGA